jgi:hypothetical protein
MAEIPTLRLDMQAQQCDIPFVCFGEQKRTFQMNGTGTLHFYTDDYRYTQVWEHPEQILHHNPANIVEINYSLFNEMPLAFAMQRIYKKRWLARAMQDKGIRIFVDLNVAQKFYKLNMLGVPHGWSSFCTRGYSDRTINLEFEYEMARLWAGDNPLLFVIYGGGIKCKQFALEHGCVYVSSTLSVKKRTRKAFDSIKSNIAFLGEEFDPTNLLPDALAKVKNEQIDDFRKQKEIEVK